MSSARVFLAVAVALAAGAADAQASPLGGLARDALAPGVHVDATGRTFVVTRPAGTAFGPVGRLVPVQPHALGPWLGVDVTGAPVTAAARPLTPQTGGLHGTTRNNTHRGRRL